MKYNLSVFNKKNKHTRAYSLRFYKYFLSYILLLVLVLSILGVVVYRNFIVTMRDEVKKANISSITQIKSLMDTRLREMERTALNISYNNNLKGYNILDKGINSLEAVRELKKYKSANEFVYDISLFYNYNNNDRIYTTLISVNLDTFFKNIYRYENWDKDKFLNIIDSLDTPTMYPVQNVKVGGNNKRFATYIYPLPIYSSKPYMVLSFFIEEEVILDMLNSALNEYDGYIYILDRDNNPISYSIKDSSQTNNDTHTPMDILDSIMEIFPEHEETSIDMYGNNYSLTTITSEYNGWTYIMAIKTEQMMEKVNASRSMFIYAILTVLFLGIMIAFAFASNNYRPLRKLTEFIKSQNKDLIPLTYSDEFDYVFETIKEVSDKNKNLAIQLRSKSDIMRDQIIIKLLKNKGNDFNELEGMARSYGLTLDLPYFVVMMLFIDDYKQFETDIEKNSKDLIIFSIINVIEELSENIGHGYGVELVGDRGVALLLNLKEEYIKERHLSELAFKTKELFKEHFNFTLTIGIGNIYRDITMINESFLEANRAVYYRLVRGNDNVIFYEEIRTRQKKQYKYPIALEKELIMSLKQGNRDEVERITKAITGYIRENSMSLEAIQCICFGIINSIMKALNEMNIEPNDCFNNDWHNLFAQPLETVDDLSLKIVDFCSVICVHVEKQKESKNFKLREKLIDMVEQNYTDPSLSLEGIADEFGMSPSYVSRYFKDQVGEPIMQYVDMLRMNDVKKLLKGTDMPLKDILPQVGYVDQSSFYRKFKKLEGLTPMQYRNISRNGS